MTLDPGIILKLMFLLFRDNIASEREVMPINEEQLDYLWFLIYELDDPKPEHSVFSIALARWGRDVFAHTPEYLCGLPPAVPMHSGQNGTYPVRHDQQELIDQGPRQANSAEAKKNRIRRRWLMEGIFGKATQHHLKRSHYRRLGLQQIQDFLIASVQNIKKLIMRATKPRRGSAAAAQALYFRFKQRSNLLINTRGRRRTPKGKGWPRLTFSAFSAV